MLPVGVRDLDSVTSLVSVTGVVDDVNPVAAENGEG
jgi:hypothetical protein